MTCQEGCAALDPAHNCVNMSAIQRKISPFKHLSFSSCLHRSAQLATYQLCAGPFTKCAGCLCLLGVCFICFLIKFNFISINTGSFHIPLSLVCPDYRVSLFAEEPSVLLLFDPYYGAAAVTRRRVSVGNWQINTLLRLNIRVRQDVTQAGCFASFEKANTEKEQIEESFRLCLYLIVFLII